MHGNLRRIYPRGVVSWRVAGTDSQRRCLGSLLGSGEAASSRIGFELGASCNGNSVTGTKELQLLGEALVQGTCGWIIGKSGKDITAPYDCFYDLKTAGSISKEVSIAHCLDMAIPRNGENLSLEDYHSTVSRWASELREVRRSLGPQSSSTGSHISVISLPLASLFKVCKTTDMDRVDFALQLFRETLTGLNLCTDEQVGFTVSTPMLLAQDVHDAFKIDKSYPGFSDVRNFFIKAQRESSKGALFLPMNPFASGMSSKLLGELQLSSSWRTFAVETLRYHPLRPGNLIGLPNLNSLDTSGDLVKYLTEFQRSLDCCMKLEKGYLHKFKDSGLDKKVRVTSVCLGHVLAAQFSDFGKRSIITIDDWNFVKDNEVNYNFQSSLETIKTFSKEGAEWVLIYQPLARQMLFDLETLLEFQKRDLDRRFVTAVMKSNESQSSKNYSSYLANYALRENLFGVYCFSDKVTILPNKDFLNRCDDLAAILNKAKIFFINQS